MPSNFSLEMKENNVSIVVFGHEVDALILRRFAIRASTAGIATCLAFLISLLPYAAVSDCRANYMTAHYVDIIQSALMTFLLSLMFGSYPVMIAVAVLIGFAIWGAMSTLFKAITFSVIPSSTKKYINVKFRPFLQGKILAVCKFLIEKRLIKRKKALLGFGYILGKLENSIECYINFSLGAGSIITFFYAIHVIGPIFFQMLSWDQIIFFQTKSTIACVQLQLLPGVEEYINPYLPVQPF